MRPVGVWAASSILVLSAGWLIQAVAGMARILGSWVVANRSGFLLWAPAEVGDPVFGFNRHRFGTYAQYVCWPEDGLLATRPVNLTDEEAAATPYGGLLALHCLRKVDVRAGQKVLVYGASGAVGTSAVQLARHIGAERCHELHVRGAADARHPGADVPCELHGGGAHRSGRPEDEDLLSRSEVGLAQEVQSEEAAVGDGRGLFVSEVGRSRRQQLSLI